MSKDGDNHINWKSLIIEVYRDSHAILFKRRIQGKKGKSKTSACTECERRSIKMGGGRTDS